jgi:hypothetical protein
VTVEPRRPKHAARRYFDVFPAVRASRHESAICFECHELDSPEYSSTRAGARQLIAWLSARQLQRDVLRIPCMSQNPRAMRSHEVRGAFQRPFGWGPAFSSICLLDPARILWPPRRRRAIERMDTCDDVSDRRVQGSLHEPEFAAPRRATPHRVFSNGIQCIGTPLRAVDQ